MHICQIEIDNFKSFAEKTVIPFERGFTTVSGPNGSGKSNIGDAIISPEGEVTKRIRPEPINELPVNGSELAAIQQGLEDVVMGYDTTA